MTHSNPLRALYIHCALFVAALVLPGCGGSDEDDIATRQNRLLGGDIVGAETIPAAVGWGATNVGCTGTFITLAHILTAAHCITGLHAGDTIYYSNASDFKAATLEVRKIRALHVQPAYDPVNATVDFGIIELDTLGTIAPMEYGAQDFVIGDLVGVVGYGCHAYWRSDDYWTRRYGTNEVVGLTDTRVIVGPANGAVLCSGDSGGPLVAASRLVGVSSVSWVRGSEVVQSGFAKIDSNIVAWIDAVRAARRD